MSSVTYRFTTLAPLSYYHNHMTYTTNKHMPRIRREAAQLVRKGWSARKVGRHLGFHHTAIMKWVKKSRKIGYHPIPTKSSRPKSHPKKLSQDIIEKIVSKRLERNRYAEALHKELMNEGVKVSLSSVKRTLDRRFLLKKRSPWKRFHPHVDRPVPKYPGDLVELDSIHLMTGKKTRIYVMTLIDVNSRYVFARSYEKISSLQSVKFVNLAKQYLPFKVTMFQSDHGPEFGKYFQDRISEHHRFTRIGKPNDNAHIERFNRTIQEELLDKLTRKVLKINCALKKYLQYYNNERVHGGIEFNTPGQVVLRY